MVVLPLNCIEVSLDLVDVPCYVVSEAVDQVLPSVNLVLILSNYVVVSCHCIGAPSYAVLITLNDPVGVALDHILTALLDGVVGALDSVDVAEDLVVDSKKSIFLPRYFVAVPVTDTVPVSLNSIRVPFKNAVAAAPDLVVIADNCVGVASQPILEPFESVLDPHNNVAAPFHRINIPEHLVLVALDGVVGA